MNTYIIDVYVGRGFCFGIQYNLSDKFLDFRFFKIQIDICFSKNAKGISLFDKDFFFEELINDDSN